MRAHFNGFLELKKPFIILNTFKRLPQQQSKTYDYFYAYFFAIKAYLLHLKPYGGINCNLKSILFLSQITSNCLQRTKEVLRFKTDKSVKRCPRRTLFWKHRRQAPLFPLCGKTKSIRKWSRVELSRKQIFNNNWTKMLMNKRNQKDSLWTIKRKTRWKNK